MFDRVAERIAHARERGGDVSRADEAHAKARKAVAMGAFAEARRHTDSAIGLAEDARKYSRAEAFLLSVQAEAEAARKAGADLTEAREIVAQAREALRNGVYADVQKFSRLAGVAIREARRFSQEEVPIKIAEREVKKEERRGSDAARARQAVDTASAALQERDFAKSRALAKEALDFVQEASILRRIRESLISLSLDSEDLRTGCPGLVTNDARRRTTHT